MILIAIALIGAVTGVASIAITVWQHMISGPRLRVEVAQARFNSESSIIGGQAWAQSDAKVIAQFPIAAVAVSVINYGRMATYINRWGIMLPANMMLHDLQTPINPNLPARIEPGERLTFFADIDMVARGARAAYQTFGGQRGEISGVVHRGDGKSAKSPAMILPPEMS